MNTDLKSELIELFSAPGITTGIVDNNGTLAVDFMLEWIDGGGFDNLSQEKVDDIREAASALDAQIKLLALGFLKLMLTISLCYDDESHKEMIRRSGRIGRGV